MGEDRAVPHRQEPGRGRDILIGKRGAREIRENATGLIAVCAEVAGIVDRLDARPDSGDGHACPAGDVGDGRRPERTQIPAHQQLHRADRIRRFAWSEPSVRIDQ